MCCHKDSSLVYCQNACYFMNTATKPITFYILPQNLLLSIYCHTHLTVYCFSCAATKIPCWCTATKPVTFHILPQTHDCVLLLMCCHKDSSLVYCQKPCYFLYTATKPVTFCILPQSLLLSIYCHKAYCCPYTATNTRIYYF